ncbi:hypothetical protein [Abyssalbus ytuae]|uniref:Uncharacterized protein n=1 Tax=Abyssalbus ytuae TaxID=2926907 RepID=A0A9E6ZUE8_9FLAO|nr:hypothetical protein [Abyssalbus ytuae]UOB19113.1 hypothetical protein MQE35_07405 [Abyssalbus ytuae]
MKKVLVFKTSVKNSKEVKKLKPILNTLTSSNGKWNFDLEDCDNILRVETHHLRPLIISSTLQANGFYCEELL